MHNNWSASVQHQLNYKPTQKFWTEIKFGQLEWQPERQEEKVLQAVKNIQPSPSPELFSLDLCCLQYSHNNKPSLAISPEIGDTARDMDIFILGSNWVIHLASR